MLFFSSALLSLFAQPLLWQPPPRRFFAPPQPRVELRVASLLPPLPLLHASCPTQGLPGTPGLDPHAALDPRNAALAAPRSLRDASPSPLSKTSRALLCRRPARLHEELPH